MLLATTQATVEYLRIMFARFGDGKKQIMALALPVVNLLNSQSKIAYIHILF